MHKNTHKKQWKPVKSKTSDIFFCLHHKLPLTETEGESRQWPLRPRIGWFERLPLSSDPVCLLGWRRICPTASGDTTATPVPTEEVLLASNSQKRS